MSKQPTTIIELAAVYERNTYYASPDGLIGVRNRITGQIDWFRWSEEKRCYQKSGSTLGPQDGTRKKIGGESRGPR